MRISNFWFYVLTVIIILHIIIAFGYLLYKLSPKKKDSNQPKKQENKRVEKRIKKFE